MLSVDCPAAALWRLWHCVLRRLLIYFSFEADVSFRLTSALGARRVQSLRAALRDGVQAKCSTAWSGDSARGSTSPGLMQFAECQHACRTLLVLQHGRYRCRYQDQKAQNDAETSQPMRARLWQNRHGSRQRNCASASRAATPSRGLFSLSGSCLSTRLQLKGSCWNIAAFTAGKHKTYPGNTTSMSSRPSKPRRVPDLSVHTPC